MKRILITILMILCAAVAVAQDEPAKPAATGTTTTTTVPTPTPTSTATVVVDADASSTRQEFRELLRRHPPEVGRVLKLDPMLFTNQQFLSTYPALAAFIQQHPEVAHAPGYYMEYVYVPGDVPPNTSSERIWQSAMEGFSIMVGFSLVATVLTWLVRTLIEHRRWNRLSQVQYDVHNKLMDRFATNEDLLRYIQTPAGKRFLESAPLQLDAVARPASPPVSRILWSLQIGLIVLAAGIGMEYISGNIDKEMSQPMFAFGVLAISVGVGFFVSAILSFLVSRRLGLWTPPVEPSPSAAE